MEKSYPIAKARDKFATLIRSVETGTRPIHLTRRGEPVAVILSTDAYERLVADESKRDFWAAYLAYKEAWQDEEMDIEGDIWADVRDKTTKSEENPWL
jgi:prevent-host-death family protein